jgi:hypothetical protein
VSRYTSAFSERSRGIQEQFLLYQLLYPKATKKQLKAFFKLINAGVNMKHLKIDFKGNCKRIRLQ